MITPNHPKEPQQESWEKELEEEFIKIAKTLYPERGTGFFRIPAGMPKAIKAPIATFIVKSIPVMHALLQSEREKARAEGWQQGAKEARSHYYERVARESRLATLKEVEGMIPKSVPQKYLDSEYFYGYTAIGAYELALQNLLSRIQEMRKITPQQNKEI